MQNLRMIFPAALLGLTSLSSLPSEPFQYKYQIVANSNSPKDLFSLYEYKEELIDLYESKYLDLSSKEIEEDLVSNINYFKLDSSIRPYYAYGTIVLMVGNANGMCLEGSFRSDSCDETVIRSKVFIFDLFT